MMLVVYNISLLYNLNGKTMRSGLILESYGLFDITIKKYIYNYNFERKKRYEIK